LHYVFDLWAERWRRREARGDMVIVRYADDFIVGFEHKEDAERFLAELTERVGKFGLGLKAEKTRLVEFGRLAARSREASGLGKPETFDFLGVFVYRCTAVREFTWSWLAGPALTKPLVEDDGTAAVARPFGPEGHGKGTTQVRVRDGHRRSIGAPPILSGPNQTRGNALAPVRLQNGYVVDMQSLLAGPRLDLPASCLGRRVEPSNDRADDQAVRLRDKPQRLGILARLRIDELTQAVDVRHLEVVRG